MRAKLSALSVALLTAGVMLACGSGPMSDIRSYSGKTYAPAAHDPTALHGQFVVPPDRALSAVHLRALAPAANGAADQVHADWKSLVTALSDLPYCELRTQNYRPPAPHDGLYRAELWGALDTDLSGVTDVGERIARVDACHGPVLAAMTFEQVAIDGTDRHRLSSIGDTVIVVDEPSAHLPALLERRSKTLTAVSAPSAPQLHPEDQRCVPRGTVSIGPRGIGGVVLTLDLDCRIDKADTVAPEG